MFQPGLEMGITTGGFWGCDGPSPCLQCRRWRVSHAVDRPGAHRAAPPARVGGWPSCWACSAQPNPTAEPIAGKHRFVKCWSGTSKAYLPQLRAEGLTLLGTVCFSLLKCCGLLIWKYSFLLWLSQGNSGGWNWCPKWLHVCSNAGISCYCCFQN